MPYAVHFEQPTANIQPRFGGCVFAPESLPNRSCVGDNAADFSMFTRKPAAFSRTHLRSRFSRTKKDPFPARFLEVVAMLMATANHAGVWTAALERRSGVWTYRSALPEGDLRIARQFTAGLAIAVARVPKGRLNPPMSYVCSYSHCVFSTKDRRPFITPQFRDRLRPYLGSIACENGIKTLSIGGVEDHVHRLWE